MEPSISVPAQLSAAVVTNWMNDSVSASTRAPSVSIDRI